MKVSEWVDKKYGPDDWWTHHRAVDVVAPEISSTGVDPEIEGAHVVCRYRDALIEAVTLLIDIRKWTRDDHWGHPHGEGHECRGCWTLSGIHEFLEGLSDADTS